MVMSLWPVEWLGPTRRICRIVSVYCKFLINKFCALCFLLSEIGIFFQLFGVHKSNVNCGVSTRVLVPKHNETQVRKAACSRKYMLYTTSSRATRVYSGNFKSTAVQPVDWCGRAPSVSGLRAVTSSVGRCVL